MTCSAGIRWGSWSRGVPREQAHVIVWPSAALGTAGGVSELPSAHYGRAGTLADPGPLVTRAR
jgi:hypothetical protein